MKLIEILNLLSQVSKELGTSTPYICGGTPRDKAMGKPIIIEDIDITTGDNTIDILSEGMAKKLPLANFKKTPDGHAQLIINKIKLDFSTNYIQPNVDNMLINAGLNNPTLMQQELYSRDFTCNTLLMGLELKKILDPIGLGIQDINKKILRTCLPAKITLSSDNKRVARVIYLAAKLNFKVDLEIINWIKNNPNSLIEDIKPDYVTKKINKALDFNPKITINLLDTMGLWPYVPPSDKLMPYISQNIRKI